MKFLFKVTFLILVSISNSVFGMKVSDLFNDKQQAPLRKTNNTQNQIEQEEKIVEDFHEIMMNSKITKDLAEIINSRDCNCTKLKLLNNPECEMAQLVLLLMTRGYITPKTEKELQNEKKELTKSFQKLDPDIIDGFIKTNNEQAKCIQKILITLNNQN